jgi:hypothetical protein
MSECVRRAGKFTAYTNNVKHLPNKGKLYFIRLVLKSKRTAQKFKPFFLFL